MGEVDVDVGKLSETRLEIDAHPHVFPILRVRDE